MDGEDWSGWNSWDPDFSEPSTSPASSSSSDSSRPPSVDPAIVKTIPHALRQPPVFPRNFIWTCPADKCHYEVNLVALTEENLLDLSPSDREFLAGPWTAHDPRLQDLWNDMVHRHLHKHLADLGIKVVPCRKTVGVICSRPSSAFLTVYLNLEVNLEWIDPKLHRNRKAKKPAPKPHEK
ncbi:hypothetical protein FA95DRAFT_1613797 [Auriscalpium vulgare]|uniref:Uncharacterized protein n=1 Tax=Auriscalpium vulgare TaxID=40419 RepID=A0ACB8R1G0_9AGAM|nr:hypothetical protein FA95DRAFT_1613797 [Auriscalpium vulgare]